MMLMECKFNHVDFDLHLKSSHLKINESPRKYHGMFCGIDKLGLYSYTHNEDLMKT
jgi:hypothetical protein